MAPTKKTTKKKSKRIYALNRNLHTMNEIDFEEDPVLVAIVASVMEQHNSAAKERVCFVKFDKVEYVYACGGTLYFLYIRVKCYVSGNESTIEKMVWKGTSMEVLETNTKKTIDSPITKNRLPAKKLADFTNLVLSVCSSDFCHLNLVRLHHFEENVEMRSEIPTQAGWFKFEMFNLIVEAKPMEGVGAKVFIDASLLRRDWLQIMDEQTTSSLRTWKDDMLKAYCPPENYATNSDSNGFPFFPLDLISPQVLTHAWLAVRDHNYKEGTNMEFVKVVKAEYGPCAGEEYYLTFEAEEGGIVKTFLVVVHEIVSIKCWKPVTLLKPCTVEDEYEMPKPWKAQRSSLHL